MKKQILSLLLLAAAVAVLPLKAADMKKEKEPRLSPHETLETTIDGDKIKLVYGRPYTKHPKTGEMRKIWGGLVPYDKVWRTGADEATLLTTERPLAFGAKTLPAGTYSVYTLPAKDGSAKLIFNKQTGHWGTVYDEKKDLLRVDLVKGATEKTVGQFTMAIEKKPAGGGVLKLEWENTRYSLPFTVVAAAKK